MAVMRDSSPCELEEGEISDEASDVKDERGTSQNVYGPRPRPRSGGSSPRKNAGVAKYTMGSDRFRTSQHSSSSHPYLRKLPFGIARCNQSWCSDTSSRVGNRGASSPLRGDGPPYSLRSRTSQSVIPASSRERRTSQLEHYSWFRRASGSARESSSRTRTASAVGSTSESSAAGKNHSQPKFLRQPAKSEPSYEDLLAQYRTIQNRLETLVKHGDTVNKSDSRPDTKKSKTKKHRHTPKCKKARKLALQEVNRKSTPRSRKNSASSVVGTTTASRTASEKENAPSEHVTNSSTVSAAQTQAASNELVLSDVSDACDEDDSLVELRRRALESRKLKQQERLREQQETDRKDGSASPSPRLVVLDELPPELLEEDSPIAEVQHKQQLRKGEKMPWFDKELTQQMRSKDRAYSKWKRHPCYENWEAFKAIKKRYLQMLKRKRAAYTTSTPDASGATVEAGDVEQTSARMTKLPDMNSLPLENIPLPGTQTAALEDNYDSVEMEVDSDGVLSSPSLEVLEQDFSDDEDEEALRAQLLQSLKRNKETQAIEDTSSKEVVKKVPDKPVAPPSPLPAVPKAKEQAIRDIRMIDIKRAEPLVISLGVDDTTSEEESSGDESENAVADRSSDFSAGLEQLLKEAREKVQQVPHGVAGAHHSTPSSVLKLSQAQQLEYRRLKAEIARREQRSLKELGSKGQQVNKARRLRQRIVALKALQNTLHAERKALQLEDKHMDTLRKDVLTKKTAIRGTQVRIQKLRAQLATMERAVNRHTADIRKANGQLQLLQVTLDRRKSNIAKLESQCQLHGKAVYGEAYQLPQTENVATTPVSKRKSSTGTLVTKPRPDAISRNAGTRPTADILAEKIRLQKLEQELRQRLLKLKQASMTKPALATPPKPLQGRVPDAPNSRVGTPTPVSTSEAQLNASVPATDPSVELKDSEEQIPEEGNKVEVAAVQETSPASPQEESEDEVAVREVTKAIQAVYYEHCTKSLKSRAKNTMGTGGSLSSEFAIPNGPLLNKLKVNLLKRPSEHIPPTPEVHSIDLRSYTSPLLHFRGYRLNPNFLRLHDQSLDSQTYSHKVQCRTRLCRYELHGKCNDDRCPWQHQKYYSCTEDEILMDLAAYSPEMLGIHPGDQPQQCRAKAERYVVDLRKKHKGIGIESLCRLVVAEVNRSLKNAPPFFMAISKRPWSLQQSLQTATTFRPDDVASSEKQPSSEKKDWRSLLQHKVDRQDPELLELESEVRYFDTALHAGVPALEVLVRENPRSEELWLRLAYRHLHNKRNSPEVCLDQALNVFSQALESNRGSPEIWRHYLSWYSVHPDSDDLDYLCRRALDYCPHNSVWWKCVTLVEGVEMKNQLCQQQLYQLTQKISQGEESEAGSYSDWVLEILLYWVQLNSVAGRMVLAFNILKASVKSVIGFEHFGMENCSNKAEQLDEATRDIVQCASMLLVPEDLGFLWLCYIYFVEFRSLPESLFSSERGSLGRLCRKDCFEIPWWEKEELLQSSHVLICAFQEAVDELGGPEKCAPLFACWLALQANQDMGAEAVLLCSSAVEENPTWAEGWLQLFKLHQALGNKDDAIQALKDGLMHSPSDAQLVFQAARHKVIKKDLVSYGLLESLVMDHFQTEDNLCLQAGKEMGDHVGFPKLLKCDNKSSIYAYLNYIEFAKMVGAPAKDVRELYETLVTMASSTSDLQTAWWNYLIFHLENLVVASNDSLAPTRVSLSALRSLTALVRRCLSGVPFHRSLPSESRQSWTDFEFANRVMDLLAAHLSDPRDRADLLASYLVDMPRNFALARRVVELYLHADDHQSAGAFLKTVMSPGVPSFHLWELAVQLAITLGEDQYEVHRLFENAVQTLPYHVDLWNHWVIYELSQGHLKHAQKAAEAAAKYQLPEVQHVLHSLTAKDLSQEEAVERLKIHLLPL